MTRCIDHGHAGEFSLPCPFEGCAAGTPLVTVFAQVRHAEYSGGGTFEMPESATFSRHSWRAACCGQRGWSWLEFGADHAPLSGLCGGHAAPTVVRRNGTTR